MGKLSRNHKYTNESTKDAISLLFVNSNTLQSRLNEFNTPIFDGNCDN